MYSIEVLVRVLSRMWRNRQTRTFQVRMPQGVWVQVPPSAVSADQMVSAFCMHRYYSQKIIERSPVAGYNKTTIYIERSGVE